MKYKNVNNESDYENIGIYVLRQAYHKNLQYTTMTIINNHENF